MKEEEFVRVWKNKIKSSSRGLARRTPVGGVRVTSRDQSLN